jgi:hypothetical protein
MSGRGRRPVAGGDKSLSCSDQIPTGPILDQRTLTDVRIWGTWLLCGREKCRSHISSRPSMGGGYCTAIRPRRSQSGIDLTLRCRICASSSRPPERARRGHGRRTPSQHCHSGHIALGSVETPGAQREEGEPWPGKPQETMQARPNGPAETSLPERPGPLGCLPHCRSTRQVSGRPRGWRLDRKSWRKGG